MTDIVERLNAERRSNLYRISDLEAENAQLRHDIERHVAIGAEQANEIERLKAIIASFNSSPSN